MIQQIYIDNYKCLVNFQLKLDALTLLLGRNGTGKSTALEALTALRRLLAGRSKIGDPDTFPTSSKTRWQNVPVQCFRLELKLGHDFFSYCLEVKHPQDGSAPRIQLERLVANGNPLFLFGGREVQLFRDDYSEGTKYAANPTESALARVAERGDNQKLTSFLKFIQKIIICSIYPKSFEGESKRESKHLAGDGSNFASWYRHVLQEHQDLMHDYISELREVIDGFSGLRLEQVGSETRALQAVFDHPTRYELRLDELSDGQRALLLLYAFVHLTKNQGYTLFLDEPDNYVALSELQPWMMQLSDACGQELSQAIICSHNPEVIDYLGPESGQLLQREAAGHIVIRPVASLDAGDRIRLSEIIAREWTE